MRFRQRELAYDHNIKVGTDWVEYPAGTVLYSSDKIVNTILDNDVFSLKEECFDELHAGPPYKEGGPFTLTRTTTDYLTVKSPVSWANANYFYEGGFIPFTNPLSFLPYRPADYGDISYYGASGWNKFRPTKPRIQAGVSLAELRELPRMLKSTCKSFMLSEKATKASKQSAESWLNYNFGWLPFLNDLRDFYKLTKSLDSRLKQLKRDNNRWVKRGGTIKSQKETSIVYEWSTSPLWPPPSNQGSNGSGKVVLEESEDIWFSARFRYYIPSPNEYLWRGKALAMLFGGVNLPSILYELTPWSWLLDWCSNTGDLVEMLGSVLFENVVAKYAYAMGYKSDTVTFDGTRIPIRGDTAQGTWFAKNEWKTRSPGSSFGFDLTPDNFSARQWSILGALGLSRL